MSSAVGGDGRRWVSRWQVARPAGTACPAAVFITWTGRGTARYLWLEQSGECLVCGQPLTLEAGWHVHHLLWRVFGGDDDIDNLVLLHPNCHRQVHSEGLVVEKFASREGRS